MARGFSVEDWLDFVESNEAFSVKIKTRPSRDRIVILCSDGINIFNREMYELALDLLNFDDDISEVYHSEVRRFGPSRS